MGDESKSAKPDGSAWKAHMEQVSARNEAVRKAGREERAERERSELASLRGVEARRAAERRRRIEQHERSARLLRSDD